LKYYSSCILITFHQHTILPNTLFTHTLPSHTILPHTPPHIQSFHTIFPHSPMHNPLISLTQPPIYSLIPPHSPTQSLTSPHPLTHLTHPLTQSPHSLTHLTHSLTSLTHSLTHSPKLDEAGSGQDGTHGPLCNLAGVVLELCCQNCSTLGVQFLTPLHPSSSLQGRESGTTVCQKEKRGHRYTYTSNTLLQFAVNCATTPCKLTLKIKN